MADRCLGFRTPRLLYDVHIGVQENFMSEIGLVVTLKVKPGSNADFESAFAEQAANCSRNEPGQLLYKLFKQRDQQQSYFIIERYKDSNSLDIHRAGSWMALTRDRVRATLDGPIVVVLMDAVD